MSAAEAQTAEAAASFLLSAGSPFLPLRALPVAEATVQGASAAVQLAVARTARSCLVALHALVFFLEAGEHSRPTKHPTIAVEPLVSVGYPAEATTHLRPVATARLESSDPPVAQAHKLPQSFPPSVAVASG